MLMVMTCVFYHSGMQAGSELASCLIYSYALIEYINRFAVDRMVTFFLLCYLPGNSLVFFIFHEKC